jgi:hypothetical protein
MPARLQECAEGTGDTLVLQRTRARTLVPLTRCVTIPQQGKPEDAAKFLVHSGALIKPACSALTSKQPRLCILGMQARLSGCDELPRTHTALQLVVHLTNASALLPSHCVTIAPILKDARDGLDESGSLKFLQLLSALCLLPAFVSQSQCSAAGEAAHAARSCSSGCVEPRLQLSQCCCLCTRIATLSSAKQPRPSPLWQCRV